MTNNQRVIALFHDQIVSGFSKDNGVVRIDLQCYASPDKDIPVSVFFYGVQNIVVDHMHDAEISMIYDEGQIVEFDVTGQTVTLIIEWDSFETRDRLMKFYNFTFDRMEISDSAKLL